MRDSDSTQRVTAAETRLLYQNVPTAIAVTVVISSLLVYAHWDLRPRAIVLGWFLFMVLVATARLVLAQRYQRAATRERENRRWNLGFVANSALL